MAAARRNKMLLFFILLLHFKGAVSQLVSRFVRAGDDVTLSCENVIKHSQNCDTTTWEYSKTPQSTVELFVLGQIKHPTSDRLSLTSNCSLLIKKVSDQDVGRYNCRQYEGGKRHLPPDASVQLSVVHLTEQKNQNQNQVTLGCSVFSYEPCKHVRWLFNDKVVDKNHPNIKLSPSPSSCSAAAIVPISHFILQSKQFLKCEVKTDENKVQFFTFSSHPADKETTTTSAATTRTTTSAADSGGNKLNAWLWLFVSLPLVVVVLTTLIFTLIVLKRNKRKKNQNYSNPTVTSDPLAAQPAPEMRPNEADPEDGVPYASISYTRKPNNKVKKDDDAEVAVTYSTVKASSSDPSSLYASVNV